MYLFVSSFCQNMRKNTLYSVFFFTRLYVPTKMYYPLVIVPVCGLFRQRGPREKAFVSYVKGLHMVLEILYKHNFLSVEDPVCPTVGAKVYMGHKQILIFMVVVWYRMQGIETIYNFSSWGYCVLSFFFPPVGAKHCVWRRNEIRIFL